MILLATSCQQAAEVHPLGLKIKLSNDRSAIEIKGIPQELCNELQEQAPNDPSWDQLVAVYEDLNDPEIQDLVKPLKGTYELRQQSLLFRPAHPFQKGRHYLVQVYAQHLQLNVINLFQTQGWRRQQKPLEYRFQY